MQNFRLTLETAGRGLTRGAAVVLVDTMVSVAEAGGSEGAAVTVVVSAAAEEVAVADPEVVYTSWTLLLSAGTDEAASDAFRSRGGTVAKINK